MVNLAESYAFQDRLEEAEALMSQAVKLSIEAMGRRHHRTQAAITNLARLYKRLGESHKAQETEKLLG
jgi:translation initiation factor IF-3